MDFPPDRIGEVPRLIPVIVIPVMHPLGKRSSEIKRVEFEIMERVEGNRDLGAFVESHTIDVVLKGIP